MKNLIKISFLFVVMIFVILCVMMKENNIVLGKVDLIEIGKDGYIVKIIIDVKEVYFVIISIVNVGGFENYK